MLLLQTFIKNILDASKLAMDVNAPYNGHHAKTMSNKEKDEYLWIKLSSAKMSIM